MSRVPPGFIHFIIATPQVRQTDVSCVGCSLFLFSDAHFPMVLCAAVLFCLVLIEFLMIVLFYLFFNGILKGFY